MVASPYMPPGSSVLKDKHVNFVPCSPQSTNQAHIAAAGTGERRLESHSVTVARPAGKDTIFSCGFARWRVSRADLASLNGVFKCRNSSFFNLDSSIQDTPPRPIFMPWIPALQAFLWHVVCTAQMISQCASPYPLQLAPKMPPCSSVPSKHHCQYRIFA
ncbi:hypothetical protein BU26DRAFT_11691 [Trematosphaeria pertusa]|uniref:Uncharacterized protein n=1 Tax=Trematosphaeria pertusa TaxID=390896 RepID=A0A6A6J161_9PLEO|nr:uncharacterized protein BU26DRAFT_11691 [Trematosphaeria pertusa]KAF2255912.1 hypothetical protein BU26DRAFT_11691 [Trematosphaeria pertusa]